MERAQSEAIDAWAEDQGVSRPEAIRRLLQMALSKGEG
ncbi:ribbon-helix-helix protein, CopG family [Kozakia baliensis]